MRRRSSLDKRVVLIVAGGAVLLIVAVVGAVFMLGGGGGSGGRSVSRAVRYLPDDAEVVFSVNMSAITKSKLWQKVEKQPAVKQALDKMRTEGNMDVGDIVHFTAGVSMKGDAPVFIVETHKRIDRKTIFGRVGAKRKRRSPARPCTCARAAKTRRPILPNDRTVVFGTKRALRAVLERKGDPPAKVKSLADQLKGSAGFSMAMKPPQQAAGPMAGANEYTKGVQSMAVHADVGSDVRVSAELICKDGEAAKKLKELSDQQLGELGKDPNVPAAVPRDAAEDQGVAIRLAAQRGNHDQRGDDRPGHRHGLADGWPGNRRRPGHAAATAFLDQAAPRRQAAAVGRNVISAVGQVANLPWHDRCYLRVSISAALATCPTTIHKAQGYPP